MYIIQDSYSRDISDLGMTNFPPVMWRWILLPTLSCLCSPWQQLTDSSWMGIVRRRRETTKRDRDRHKGKKGRKMGEWEEQNIIIKEHTDSQEKVEGYAQKCGPFKDVQTYAAQRCRKMSICAKVHPCFHDFGRIYTEHHDF